MNTDHSIAFEQVMNWPKDCPAQPDDKYAAFLQLAREGKITIRGASGAGTGVATITAGANTVQLYHVNKYDIEHPTRLAEVDIPGREGGQIQYLGSHQRRYAISGIADASAEVTAINTTLETIRADTANDATLTLYYGSDSITSVTSRVESIQYWPIAGSGRSAIQMATPFYWFSYLVKLRRKV